MRPLRLTTASSSPALILEIPAAEVERTVYAIKRLSSSFRAASLEGDVGLDARRDRFRRRRTRSSRGLRRRRSCSRRADALPADSAHPAWILASGFGDRCRRSPRPWPRSSRRPPRRSSPCHPAAARFRGRRRPPCHASRRYFTADVSPDPTATTRTRRDGSTAAVLRYFDAKAFTPILLLPDDPAGESRIALSGGPFEKATVENLASGVRRDFELKGAPVLTLDLSRGPARRRPDTGGPRRRAKRRRPSTSARRED